MSLIDSSRLKHSLEKQKFLKSKDTAGVVERCYNRGLNTAIKIIEFYEEDANRAMRDFQPMHPDNK